MDQTSTTREARLRPEYRVQYPQLEPGVWMPAVKLRDQVVAVQPASGGAERTGRALNDHHFEFRGTSPREPGGPIGLSRMTDAVAGGHTVTAERDEREHRLAAREREADQGIQQAEELQARVEQVTVELDRLRHEVEQSDAGLERTDQQPND
jgi:hypothetical protein